MTSLDDAGALLRRKAILESSVRRSPGMVERLRDLRAWQAARFAQTYADLRREARYSGAIDFFLRDVYGPQDFSVRDRDLERAVAYFGRLLPAAASVVLVRSIELDVLTVELDQGLLPMLPENLLSETSYAIAYRALGKAELRQRQLDLLLDVISGLDRLARQPLIGLLLSGARLPAQLAGFGVLQRFLETGFVAFEHMRDVESLLRIIRERETCFMQALVSGTGETLCVPPSRA